ncbi:MAG: DUF4276 family protein [Betaproteobacteria bacterium]|nr:DUF4276 family protein [Betaproteobacteria bacterium]
MVALKLYVEGGGDQRQLKNRCREGFAKFLEKAGLQGHLPRIIASGSRKNAFDDFCIALKAGESALLLVDSEDLVSETSPWEHLLNRPGDKWTMPQGATDDLCHLMIVCMESWLLADRQTLKKYFGSDFKESALPATSRPIESLDKDTVMSALKKATRDCQSKGGYNKGSHSFDLLALLDPNTVAENVPSAKRFIDALKHYPKR